MTGARLFLTACDTKKPQKALLEILEPGRVTLVEMDNTSSKSVRAAAKTILTQRIWQVNILINNAGIMATPNLQFTTDGYKLQFGTNHVSHFLLFQLLKPALLASSSQEFHSRDVNVASSGHKMNSINDSNNYNFQK